MKAIGLDDFGGPDVLHVVDVPEFDEVGRGWVRIRVRAASVNPVDIAVRSGFRAAVTKASNPPPYVPGFDVAGVVEEVGEGTDTDLKVGDDVIAIVQPLGSRGGYAEQVLAPARSTVRMPAGASYVEAATLPMNGLTARLALDYLKLEPGDTLAVTGSAGAVGGFAIQMAKKVGIRVVADASEADEQLVKDLGADIVVRRGDDFAKNVRAEVPDGVDGLIDAAVLDDLALPAVKDGGHFSMVRGFADKAERGITYHPVFVPNVARDHEKLDGIRKLAEEGTLSFRVADTMPAEKASEAHRRLERGGVRGRLVLEF
ncbi:NADP-dependent oxidoreductase [Rhodococcus koreensis]